MAGRRRSFSNCLSLRGYVSVRICLLSIALCLSLAATACASGAAGAPEPVLSTIGLPALDESVSWTEFADPDNGYSIRYPPCVKPSQDTDGTELVSGQVVSFRPTQLVATPLSNLVEYFFAIGITNDTSIGSSTRESETRPFYAFEEASGSFLEVQGFRFSFHYAAEGAAGSWYQKLSYRAVHNEQRYEIALFVHTVNPGALPPEATAFDVSALARQLKTMVSTFRAVP